MSNTDVEILSSDQVSRELDLLLAQDVVFEDIDSNEFMEELDEAAASFPLIGASDFKDVIKNIINFECQTEEFKNPLGVSQYSIFYDFFLSYKINQSKNGIHKGQIFFSRKIENGNPIVYFDSIQKVPISNLDSGTPDSLQFWDVVVNVEHSNYLIFGLILEPSIAIFELIDAVSNPEQFTYYNLVSLIKIMSKQLFGREYREILSGGLIQNLDLGLERDYEKLWVVLMYYLKGNFRGITLYEFFEHVVSTYQKDGIRIMLLNWNCFIMQELASIGWIPRLLSLHRQQHFLDANLSKVDDGNFLIGQSIQDYLKRAKIAERKLDAGSFDLCLVNSELLINQFFIQTPANKQKDDVNSFLQTIVDYNCKIKFGDKEYEELIFTREFYMDWLLRSEGAAVVGELYVYIDVDLSFATFSKMKKKLGLSQTTADEINLKRFHVWLVVLENDIWAHANTFIVDTELLLLEWFEPHGSGPSELLGSSKTLPIVEKKLSEFYGVELFINRGSCPLVGPQVVTKDSFCASWATFAAIFKVRCPSNAFVTSFNIAEQWLRQNGKNWVDVLEKFNCKTYESLESSGWGDLFKDIAEFYGYLHYRQRAVGTIIADQINEYYGKLRGFIYEKDFKNAKSLMEELKVLHKFAKETIIMGTDLDLDYLKDMEIVDDDTLRAQLDMLF